MVDVDQNHSFSSYASKWYRSCDDQSSFNNLDSTISRKINICPIPPDITKQTSPDFISDSSSQKPHNDHGVLSYHLSNIKRFFNYSFILPIKFLYSSLSKFIKCHQNE